MAWLFAASVVLMWGFVLLAACVVVIRCALKRHWKGSAGAMAIGLLVSSGIADAVGHALKGEGNSSGGYSRVNGLR